MAWTNAEGKNPLPSPRPIGNLAHVLRLGLAWQARARTVGNEPSARQRRGTGKKRRAVLCRIVLYCTCAIRGQARPALV